MSFRAGFRTLAHSRARNVRTLTTARTKLRIGMLPADGIGHEVIPVRFQLNPCLLLVINDYSLAV